MGSADAIFHDLANLDPTGLARLVLGNSAVTAEAVQESLPIVRRRDADAVLVVHRRGPSDALLHLECELKGRPLPPRLLEYTGILAKREHGKARKEKRARRPIVSAVLRLKGPRRPPRIRVHEVSGIEGPTVVFRYVDISVRGLRSKDLLASGHPALWTLAPLAEDGTRDDMLRRTVETIESSKLPPNQRQALMAANLTFALLVGAGRVVERMSKMINFRDLPEIREMQQAWAAKARAEALSEVLRRRLAQLGRLSRPLARKIDAVKDAAGLDRLFDIALDVGSLSEFQKRAFPRRSR